MTISNIPAIEGFTTSDHSDFGGQHMERHWWRKYKHMLLSLTLFQIAQYLLLALVFGMFFDASFFRPGA